MGGQKYNSIPYLQTVFRIFINTRYQQRTLLVKAGANVRTFSTHPNIGVENFQTFLYTPDYQYMLRSGT